MSDWKVLDFENDKHEIKTSVTNGSGKLLQVTYREKAEKETAIIKKSGGTWLLRETKYGDWICLHPEVFDTAEHCLSFFNEVMISSRGNPGYFQTIEKTELNDKIALLRPIVIVKEMNHTLAMVRNDSVFSAWGITVVSNNIDECRLATIDDLVD